jgi:hypothetical protein
MLVRHFAAVAAPAIIRREAGLRFRCVEAVNSTKAITSADRYTTSLALPLMTEQAFGSDKVPVIGPAGGKADERTADPSSAVTLPALGASDRNRRA